MNDFVVYNSFQRDERKKFPQFIFITGAFWARGKYFEKLDGV
jgi:hypothetical protein